MRYLCLTLLFLSGCSLSPEEQKKIDEFPSCDYSYLRLSNALTKSEQSCFLRENYDKKHREKMAALKLEEEKRAEKQRLDEEARERYRNSPEGKAKLKEAKKRIKENCANVISDFISTRANPIQLDRVGHHMSLGKDKYLCTIVVKYPTVHYEKRNVIEIQYNSSNGIYTYEVVD